MARTVAALPKGSRITDYISLGVVTKTFPISKIRSVLSETGKTSVRERDLPAHVVVYYVIALSLYMHSSYREVLRCLLEGVQWLLGPSVSVKVAGKSGISQARSRLGSEPMRRHRGVRYWNNLTIDDRRSACRCGVAPSSESRRHRAGRATP